MFGFFKRLSDYFKKRKENGSGKTKSSWKMISSKKIIESIKEDERFMSRPYLCPAGVPTIGYGATYYPNGKRVSLSDKLITKERATEILKYQLKTYEDAVRRYVQVELNQNQFDALVSFTYNVGVGALQKSTLLRKLNKGLYKEAANEFSKWVYGGGVKLTGLIKRRKHEKEIFLGLA